MPDKARQKELWKILGNPGAVLVDGEVAGTWRAKAAGKRLTITVGSFAPLSKATRAVIEIEIEIEAGLVAEVRGAALFDRGRREERSADRAHADGVGLGPGEHGDRQQVRFERLERSGGGGWLPQQHRVDEREVVVPSVDADPHDLGPRRHVLDRTPAGGEVAGGGTGDGGLHREGEGVVRAGGERDDGHVGPAEGDRTVRAVTAEDDDRSAAGVVHRHGRRSGVPLVVVADVSCLRHLEPVGEGQRGERSADDPVRLRQDEEVASARFVGAHEEAADDPDLVLQRRGAGVGEQPADVLAGHRVGHDPDRPHRPMLARRP